MDRVTVSEIEHALLFSVPYGRSIILQSNNTFARTPRLDDAELQQFCAMLMRHARVEIDAMQLSFLKLGDVGINALAQTLRDHNGFTLTRLDVSGNNFSPAACVNLLQIDRCEITDVRSPLRIHGFPDFNRLRSLNLSLCHTIMDDFASVVNALRTLAHLETLWLNSLRLEDAHVEQLASALDCASVRCLHLSDNKLRNCGNGLKHLLDNNQLHSLDISENYFESASLTLFLQALVDRNTSCRELHLNLVSPEEGLVLAQVLRCSSTLQSLEFYSADWDSDVFAAFAQALQYNNTLTSLSFWGLYTVSKISFALGEALATNHCLRELAMDCQFDDEPLLANLLTKNFSLTLMAIAFRSQNYLNFDTKIAKVYCFSSRTFALCDTFAVQEEPKFGVAGRASFYH
jgi:hypothetical protein